MSEKTAGAFPIREINKWTLHHACTAEGEIGFIHRISRLSRKKVPINGNHCLIFSNSWCTPIQFLLMMHDSNKYSFRIAQLIRALYEGCGIPCVLKHLLTFQCHSPLHLALISGNMHSVSVLLNHCNAELDPIHDSVNDLFKNIFANREPLQILWLMQKYYNQISSKINVNTADVSEQGFYPLHWAVILNNCDIVHFLLHVLNADPDVLDRHGRSPLDLARPLMNQNIIRLLERARMTTLNRLLASCVSCWSKCSDCE